MLFDRAQAAHRRRQPRHNRSHPPPDTHVHRRSAANGRVIGEIVRDSRLRDDAHAITDLRMVGDSDLSSELAPASDLYRAREADLRREARVFADFAVVADM